MVRLMLLIDDFPSLWSASSAAAACKNEGTATAAGTETNKDPDDENDNRPERPVGLVIHINSKDVPDLILTNTTLTPNEVAWATTIGPIKRHIWTVIV